METTEFGAFFYKSSLPLPYGLALTVSQLLSPRSLGAKVGNGHERKDPGI